MRTHTYVEHALRAKMHEARVAAREARRKARAEQNAKPVSLRKVES